ncbi:Stk1 family PASTA domain-containing Ser/Thr kinase [Corynebacterium uropygiale]|uniref:non-specific serine/threonine protein kinase n=1 Tax=Corynebacterium uropygiale TaxID=1775911 RepID=A0A9X1QRK6_9CORY|nr:Stk1 family PASTA domain-containing Ser/Thr kinase [Corynebacterium uropygiale]MCF4006269.1 Stk1 family PASTA domain-containing Ser/Thr kinase [Corynebacterium uropygiale]
MAELNVGEILEARYRIDRPIARGGMSTVYRAVDLRLARAVALKVMDQRFAADPVFRSRFRREARAMAQLSHPNLVNVYDFGSDGDHIFLVMELITGGTLRELLAESGPLPPFAAAAVMRALLTGLSAAHDAGMVHRDIKPDNVLINGNHAVKLADFGLVRAASQSTETGKIVGTVSYLSPEQVTGEEITPASDVYSAGILFFELLTGRTPFRGESQLDHAYQRLTEDVPSPSSLIEGVPHLIDELVATATARDPEQRFTDAEEFLAALDDVSRELNFPSYYVPIPHNSAAHRAAEIPPDTTGVAGPLEPTSILASEGRDDSDGLTEVIRTTRMEDPRRPWDSPTEEDGQTSILPSGQPAPPPTPAAAAAPGPQRTPARRDADRTPTPPPSAPVSNRSRTSLIAWIVCVVILTAAIALGGWWFGSGRYGEIPQVIGMTQEEATARIEQAGFSTSIREVYRDDVASAQVAGTEPAGGDKQVRGRAVTILVSRGQPTIPPIPEDRSPDAYRQALADHSLSYEQAEAEHSDDVPEGKIVRVDPSPGQVVKVDSAVHVHLSKGPAPVHVPDLKGVSVDKAREILEKAGLTLGDVHEKFDSDVAGGDVISSEPGKDTSLARGSKVSVTVSSAVEIPDILGMSRDQAAAELTSAGIGVRSVEVAGGTVADAADTVVEVSPSPGKLLDPADAWVVLKTPEKVRVPRVLGSAVKDARDSLRIAGLGIKTDDEDGDLVYRQSPRPGKEVDPGTAIKVDAF